MLDGKFRLKWIVHALALLILSLALLAGSGGWGLSQGVPPPPKPSPPAPGALSPTLLCTLTSPNLQAGGGFGSSVALGDMNGDGVKDIFISAPFEQVNGMANVGRVYIFDGQNCQPIRTYTPTLP